MDAISLSQNTSGLPLQRDADYVALSRMLECYQNLILLTPSTDEKLDTRLAEWQKRAQEELWSPLPFHRMKWLRSIEGARTLLLKLEQSAQNIKVQRTRREVVRDLAGKRMIIKKLRARVEEIGREVDSSNRNGYTSPQPSTDDDSETMYDVLQQIRRGRGQLAGTMAGEEQVMRINGHENGQAARPEEVEEEKRAQLFDSSSTVRQRQGKAPVEGSASTGTTSGFSNIQETEKKLLASSAQHENITADLLSMAAQLKQQTMQFNFSLEQDKSFVDRAVEGLEQNMSAMGVASKGMKTLQRMSEEQGFWGRLKLQLLIGGMWLAAVLLVLVGPKLRF